VHQAAHAGAGVEVVSALVGLGAFRTMKDSQGNRPVDIAQVQFHSHLIGILEPVYERHITEEVLGAIP
jgi:hypothetical protein